MALIPAVGIALLTALAPAANARTVMPPAHTVGQVKYVSGGVGIDEAAAMQRAAAHYELEVVFAARDLAGRGDYLAAIPVSIRDRAGHTVLNTTARGPYLLADLADGTYTVTATDNGVAKSQVVQVAHGAHQHVVFEW
jgi:hypothetical protein